MSRENVVDEYELGPPSVQLEDHQFYRAIWAAADVPMAMQEIGVHGIAILGEGRQSLGGLYSRRGRPMIELWVDGEGVFQFGLKNERKMDVVDLLRQRFAPPLIQFVNFQLERRRKVGLETAS